jgi:hypothetical protein
MYEKLQQQINQFYNNKYLRNRYPSLSYVPSVHGFLNLDSPDVAAVALGYKPAALFSDTQSDVNSYFIDRCVYRGNELLFLDEDSIVICERQDFNKFRAIYEVQGKDKEWGELLGYPKHLVDLFCECSAGREIPDWNTYDKKAEEIALRLCMEMD